MCNKPKNSNHWINGGEEAHLQLVLLEDNVVGNNKEEEDCPTLLKENLIVSIIGGTYMFHI
jgi:hypothetical protein